MPDLCPGYYYNSINESHTVMLKLLSGNDTGRISGIIVDVASTTDRYYTIPINKFFKKNIKIPIHTHTLGKYTQI